jgi:DNA-directed RNA polymerase specialized sigma24 family protein
MLRTSRLARQLCQHREDAEDVAQTPLLKAAQHLDGFRGVRYLGGRHSSSGALGA